jgi:NADH:ubiquinone oxidoreductase subunit H
MVGVSDMFAEWSARRYLARLTDRVGLAGLAAAAGVPALLASVDQHSAAVRDIVALGVEGSAAVATAVLLAEYARGVLDQARQQGWRLELPSSMTGWVRADWTTVRLLGVCALARGLVEPRRWSTVDG